MQELIIVVIHWCLKLQVLHFNLIFKK